MTPTSTNPIRVDDVTLVEDDQVALRLPDGRVLVIDHEGVILVYINEGADYSHTIDTNPK